MSGGKLDRIKFIPFLVNSKSRLTFWTNIRLVVPLFCLEMAKRSALELI
jgi:hypothetical protein